MILTPFFMTSNPFTDNESGKTALTKTPLRSDEIRIIPVENQKKPPELGRSKKKRMNLKTKKKSLPVKKTSTANARPGSANKIKKSEIPVLTSATQSALKLQAISWTPDPKKRIAVISGTIVREGDTIEGYSLSIIGKDDVTVKKGGIESKLLFKLK